MLLKIRAVLYGYLGKVVVFVVALQRSLSHADIIWGSLSRCDDQFRKYRQGPSNK